MLDPFGNMTNYMERMGYEESDRCLIIHLDDFGAYPEANEASIECLELGSATSASIMPVGLAYDSAKDWSLANPQYDMGVHLALTSEWVPSEYKWSSLTGGSTLDSSDGFLRPTLSRAVNSISVEDAKLETEAQVSKVINDGIDVTHIDTHQGVAPQQKFWKDYSILLDSHDVVGFYPPDIMSWGYSYPWNDPDSATTRAIESMYNRPILTTPDWSVAQKPDMPWSVENDSANVSWIVEYKQYIKDVISNLTPGLTMMIAHPAVNSTNLNDMMTGHYTGTKPAERVAHYHVFRDNEIRQHCDSEGIHLISYYDLLQEWKTTFNS